MGERCLLLDSLLDAGNEVFIGIVSDRASSSAVHIGRAAQAARASARRGAERGALGTDPW
jgi:hypothetical protein